MYRHESMGTQFCRPSTFPASEECGRSTGLPNAIPLARCCRRNPDRPGDRGTGRTFSKQISGVLPLQLTHRFPFESQ